MIGSISVIIFILILVGIDWVIKYRKNNDSKKEKEFITKLENIDDFEYVINKYLPEGYKLLYEERENTRIEKELLCEEAKNAFFREGREVRKEAVKSFDEYAMRSIYSYYDKKLYSDYYEMKKEGSIELINSEDGIDEHTLAIDNEKNDDGTIKVDENGKVIWKERTYRTPYTIYTYKLNDRGVVKFKIFFASIIYFKDTFADNSIIDEYKENIANRKFSRKEMHYS